MNRHLNTRNTRLSIPQAELRTSLALLLGLFITGSILLTPATELLTDYDSTNVPYDTQLIAERDPDHT